MAENYLQDIAAWRKEAAIEIRGMREAQRDIEKKVRELIGSEMLMALRTATLMVQRDAKRLAPSNTGRLRASIMPAIGYKGADAIEGVVGSNVIYAPYVEFGTKPHWPPLAPILRWVHLKKMAGTYSIKTRRRTGTAKRQYVEDYIVAKWIQRAIARRGTKPQKFLEQAFDTNAPRIERIFDVTARGIIER